MGVYEYTHTNLLTGVEGGVRPACPSSPQPHGEDRVRHGRVAVGTDMCVPLLLVPGVSHLRDVDPLLCRHITQSSLRESNGELEYVQCKPVWAIFIGRWSLYKVKIFWDPVVSVQRSECSKGAFGTQPSSLYNYNII